MLLQQRFCLGRSSIRHPGKKAHNVAQTDLFLGAFEEQSCATKQSRNHNVLKADLLIIPNVLNINDIDLSTTPLPGGIATSPTCVF